MSSCSPKINVPGVLSPLGDCVSASVFPLHVRFVGASFPAVLFCPFAFLFWHSSATPHVYDLSLTCMLTHCQLLGFFWFLHFPFWLLVLCVGKCGAVLVRHVSALPPRVTRRRIFWVASLLPFCPGLVGLLFIFSSVWLSFTFPCSPGPSGDTVLCCLLSSCAPPGGDLLLGAQQAAVRLLPHPRLPDTPRFLRWRWPFPLPWLLTRHAPRLSPMALRLPFHRIHPWAGCSTFCCSSQSTSMTFWTGRPPLDRTYPPSYPQGACAFWLLSQRSLPLHALYWHQTAPPRY